jgi:hypothetical protein
VSGAVDPFGFTWGPTRVERMFHDDRVGYVIRVMTDHVELQIAVSPQGRSIRTFKRRWSRVERRRRREMQRGESQRL